MTKTTSIYFNTARDIMFSNLLTNIFEKDILEMKKKKQRLQKIQKLHRNNLEGFIINKKLIAFDEIEKEIIFDSSDIRYSEIDEAELIDVFGDIDKAEKELKEIQLEISPSFKNENFYYLIEK